MQKYLQTLSHIFGAVTGRQYKTQLTKHVKELYKLCFECTMDDQDKWWAPHICLRCTDSLSAWVKDKRPDLMFG